MRKQRHFAPLAIPFFPVKYCSNNLLTIASLCPAKYKTISCSAIFGNLDFTAIANNPEFKEAGIRSFIIDPLLRELGCTADNIILEKSVQIQTGSRKQTTPYYADYVLKIGDCFVCVIEAKAPQKNITETSLIDQAFTYASHHCFIS